MKGETDTSIYIMKKMLRKDAEALLIQKMEDAQSLIENDPCMTKLRKPVNIKSFLRAGKNMEHMFCPNCGFDDEFDTYVRVCPRCHASSVIDSPYRSLTDKYTTDTYVEVEGDRYFFYEFNYNHVIPEEFANQIDWECHPSAINVTIKAAAVFDKECGLFIYLNKYKCNKLLGNGSSMFEAERKNLTKSEPVNACGKTAAELEKEIDQYFTVQETKKKNQKMNKSQTLAEMRRLYKGKTVSITDITPCPNILTRPYSVDGNNQVLHVCCTHCGFEGNVSVSGSYDIDVQCPNCGNHKRLQIGRYYRKDDIIETDYVRFENTSLPNNDLLLRHFRLCEKIGDDYKIHSSFYESERVFIDEKGCYLYQNIPEAAKTTRVEYYLEKNPDVKEFQKDSLTHLSDVFVTHYSMNTNCKTMQSNDEIREIIENSSLNNSGLVEAFGLNPVYNSLCQIPDLKYIRTWVKNNGIEQVMKSGNPKIINYMMDNPDALGKGTKLHEILQVDPFVARIATSMKLSYQQMVDLSALYEADHAITKEIYQKIKDADLPINNVLQARQIHDVSYKRLMDYLDSVYQHQCIDRKEALQIWLDYIRMAKYIHLDLKNKNKKYPNSLKKEHDIAMFTSNILQQNIQLEKFQEQCLMNKRLEYSYQSLFVKLPDTPQDIINEASRQQNCLRTYIESVAEGVSVICFIRFKSAPDDTYYTVEIKGNEITQVRGFHNVPIDNSALREFVHHWATAKHLIERF